MFQFSCVTLQEGGEIFGSKLKAYIEETLSVQDGSRPHLQLRGRPVHMGRGDDDDNDHGLMT